MRKELKKASEHIGFAKEILEHVSKDQKIPEDVKTKAGKIASALDIDLNELERMRSH